MVSTKFFYPDNGIELLVSQLLRENQPFFFWGGEKPLEELALAIKKHCASGLVKSHSFKNSRDEK